MNAEPFSDIFTFVGYATEHTPEELERIEWLKKRAKQEWDERMEWAKQGLPY